MRNKVMSLLLALALILGLFPVPALAAAPTSGDCGDEGDGSNLSWSFSGNTLTIQGSGGMKNYGLGRGNAPWSEYALKITAVELPEGLTSIGDYAFDGCENLRQISLPGTLETIGGCAFFNCRIETLHLPKAFKDDFTGLMDFYALRALTVDPENPNFSAKDGVVFTKDGSSLCFYPEGRPDPSYEIPAGTTSIAEWAFYQTQYLETISIPGCVKTIGKMNFCDCPALKKAVLEEGIEIIGGNCFSSCSELTEISIPDSVRDIGRFFLAVTAIQNDRSRWENGLFYLDGWMINSDDTISPDCTVRPGTKGVAGAAFYQNQVLQSVALPDGLTVLGNEVFFECANLVTVRLPESLTAINRELFKSCNQLKTVNIPAALESIGFCAFMDCAALPQLSLPKTLTVIDDGAFLDCTSLKDIYYEGSRMEWEAIRKPGDLLDENVTTLHFAGSDALCGHCGAEGDGSNLTWTLDGDTLTISGTGAMGTDTDWSTYRGRIRKIIVEEGVTTLSRYAFYKCYAMEEISLPETLTVIDFGVFSGCTSLKRIHIPAAVTEIDESGVFDNCFGLEVITVAGENQNYEAVDGVLFRIADRTLLHYPAAKADEAYCIPDGTHYIGTFNRYPFEDAINLKTVGVPFSVTEAGTDRDRFLNSSYQRDIYYEGPKSRWDVAFDTPEGLAVHCDWTYGSAMPGTLRPLRSNQNGGQNRGILHSYLNAEPDNTVSRVETDGYRVILERYDAELNLIEQRVIGDLSKEGFYFGGCYFGTDRNFLVFGRLNLEEKVSHEVIRVVSYTKDWQQLEQAHYNGTNTSFPFTGGSLRMVQNGEELYIHTCHEMFRSSDGFCHQSNLTLDLHLPTMEIQQVNIRYVSHSFNQFVRTDGNKLLTVDHGDGYPRGILLTDGSQESIMLKISSEIGDNRTGVNLGGFEISGSSYLVAGNTVDQEAGNLEGQRNAFLSVLPRGRIGAATPKLIFLTDYQEGGNLGPSTPDLVRISDDRLLVLWTEDDITNPYAPVPGPLCWQMVDGTGTPVSPVYRDEAGMLSDCQPILRNGEVIWYATDNSAPVFFRISPDHPEKLMIGNEKKLFTVTVDGVVHEGVQPGTPLAQLLPERPPKDGHTLVWQENGKTVDVNSTVQRDMVLTSAWQFDVFTDVKQGDWFYEGVRYTTFNGLFSGVSETQFGPQRKMNRAMVVQVLYSMAGKPDVTPSTEFRDVPANAWFAKAVTWAVQNGVASGYGNGLFGAKDVITREQLAVMLYGYAGKPAVKGGLHFADEAEISGWAKNALQWAVENEIMSGVGENRISPKTSATRAAGAVMIMKLHQYFKK